MADLKALGTPVDKEWISFADRETNKIYPVLTTMIRNTRQGTVQNALDKLKRETHSTLLFSSGLDMFKPVLIPASTEPEEDDPGISSWIPAAQMSPDLLAEASVHRTEGHQLQEAKGCYYSGAAIFLPEGHNLRFGFAMDLDRLSFVPCTV